MERDQIIVLVCSFAIAAFGGLSAYLRTCFTKERIVFDAVFFLGVVTALCNGGSIGIAVSGFCQWKWDGKAHPLLIFGLCSVIGLGGMEMVYFILGIIRYHMHMKTPEA